MEGVGSFVLIALTTTLDLLTEKDVSNFMAGEVGSVLTAPLWAC